MPCRNRAAPLYWSAGDAARSPDRDEARTDRGRASAKAVTAASTSPVPLIAITPCRLVDTRDERDRPATGLPRSRRQCPTQLHLDRAVRHRRRRSRCLAQRHRRQPAGARLHPDLPAGRRAAGRVDAELHGGRYRRQRRDRAPGRRQRRHHGGGRGLGHGASHRHQRLLRAGRGRLREHFRGSGRRQLHDDRRRQ